MHSSSCSFLVATSSLVSTLVGRIVSVTKGDVDAFISWCLKRFKGDLPIPASISFLNDPTANHTLVCYIISDSDALSMKQTKIDTLYTAMSHDLLRYCTHVKTTVGDILLGVGGCKGSSC